MIVLGEAESCLVYAGAAFIAVRRRKVGLLIHRRRHEVCVVLLAQDLENRTRGGVAWIRSR
jgi:hypothetical protein